MSIWFKDTPNRISVLWKSANPDLKIQYKDTSGVGSWVDIGTPTSIGDQIHAIDHTFTSTGDYLIRVLDNNTLEYVMDKLKVKPTEACDCVAEAEVVITDKLDTLDLGLRQVLSNLGDEINQNEVTIINANKTMTLTI